MCSTLAAGRHQTLTDPDPEHVGAAALRRTRFGLATTTRGADPGQVVPVRDLSAVDAVFGIQGHGAPT